MTSITRHIHGPAASLRARASVVLASSVVAVTACGAPPVRSGPDAPAAAGTPAVTTSARYEDLLALFRDWRTFQRPRVVDGVPDYSPSAMAAQHAALPGLQARLAAIDPAGWPVARQADYHVVRAEMHGLDFDHRVLKPWANNPAFYATVFASESDQPAREGPFAVGAVELWSYTFPLSGADAAAVAADIRAIPALLAQARTNLTGAGKDLWTFGARDLAQQARDLEALAGRLTPAQSALAVEVERARSATADFAAWVQQQAATKSGPSGVGEASYDWYLRHVMLVPHTWREVVGLMQRELVRAHSSLALEEARNAALPPQPPITTAEEHARRFPAAVSEYMRFLRDRNVMTVRDYMEPRLQERVGRFSPGPREFFTEVDYRDPMVMRTHGYHWFDKGRMALLPHESPVRQGALLYNIFITRTEGLATGWEEMMMHAGLFDREPRSRELVWILLAQRAARALGDLRMHGTGASIEEAAVFTSANTPRQWLRLEANLVRSEQHLYLQQPGYGISYVIGKIEIERLLADRQRQLGDRFTMRQFVDELDAVGQIPMSLIRWELTGEASPEVTAMLESRTALGAR